MRDSRYPLAPGHGPPVPYGEEGAGPVDFPPDAYSWEEPEPQFLEYLHLLRRHWRTVAGAGGACFVLALLYVLVASPQYTAESQILIERRTPQVLDVRQLLADGMTGDESNYYRTQEKILASHTLAVAVIRQLGLERNPHFAPHLQERRGLVAGWIASAREGLRALLGSEEVPHLGPGGVDIEVLEEYEEALSVSPVSRTRLAVLAVTTPDPDLSARIANAHVRAYVQHGLRLRSQASEDAREFLEGKLGELKERLELSEIALNAYRRDKGILSLDEKENVVVERLSSLNELHAEAEAERIHREAEAKLIGSRDYDSLPEVANNTLIQAIKGQLGELESEYVELSAQFKEGYPAVQKARAQVVEMRGRLRDEIASIAASIQSAFLAAVDNEQQLAARLEIQKTKVLALKDAAVQYAILKRETDSNRSLYQSILQRMKEVGISSAVEASNVSVIDSAYPPEKPSAPRWATLLPLALLLGLGGGAAFVFGRSFLDSSLGSPEEVERYVGLASLGVIPDFQSLPVEVSARGQARVEESDAEGAVAAAAYGAPLPATAGLAASHAVAVSEEGFSVVTEAYRTCRTAILFSRPEAAPQTLLFTSAVASEGKTTTVLNTAVVFSQLDARVLVIDADLRRPRCHALLGIEKRAGLSELITGQRDFDSVVHPTDFEGVSLIGAGAMAPNPTELLASRAMAELLERAAKLYDYVLIDSPPITAVNDAVVLSPMVEGVLLVVRAHETPRKIVQRAEARLRQARAPMLGVLLNQLDGKSDHYSTYYGGKYYSSYYRAGESPRA